MPTDTTGTYTPVPPDQPPGPIISASRGQVLITGSGFLPNHSVTIRITYLGEDIVDYFTDVSDANGGLSVPLQETAFTGCGHITVTDHRPHPDGDGGPLWSNTVIVTHTGR